MSHDYHLRPNVKARMQRRLNAYVAAFGEQNRDKIFAEPSKTGQGVHLRFDRERSLSPDPNQIRYEITCEVIERIQRREHYKRNSYTNHLVITMT